MLFSLIERQSQCGFNFLYFQWEEMLRSTEVVVYFSGEEGAPVLGLSCCGKKSSLKETAPLMPLLLNSTSRNVEVTGESLLAMVSPIPRTIHSVLLLLFSLYLNAFKTNIPRFVMEFLFSMKLSKNSPTVSTHACQDRTQC